MNLLKLMDAGTDPGRVRAALLCHFDAVTVLEITAGGWPYQHVLVCERDHQVRLAVLFGWVKTGWRFSACFPKHILPRLSLCEGQ